MNFNPANWYWAADDGRVYASARQLIVAETDDAFQSAQATGRKTRWPIDDNGAQTLASLSAVVSAYGLRVPGYAAIPTSVTSAQAKIQCLRTPSSRAGKTLLDDITAAVQATGGEAQIWFAEARTWERNNPYVLSLSSGLKLTSDQVDQLFAQATQIAA